MPEIMKVGLDEFQVNNGEADKLRELFQEGGPGLTGPILDPALIFKQPVPEAVPTPRTVHQRIVQAMRAVSYVAKDGFNTHFKYPFRGIDGVVNALGPALREAGVFPAAEVLEIKYRDGQTGKGDPTREVTVRVRYTFWGEDGDSVTTEGVGESIDQSDKGTAKAMSVSLRVALLGLFLLPTQEPTTDHDGHYHQRGEQRQMSAFERSTGLALLRPPTAEERAAGNAGLVWASFVQGIDFRACIEEHSAWEMPTNGDESPTWEELYAARVAAEIAIAPTTTAARALWDFLKDQGLNMSHQGKKFTELVKERGLEIQQAQRDLADQHTQAVLETSDPEMLESIAWRVAAARNCGDITAEQADTIREIHAERLAKLRREQNNTPTTDPSGAPDA